MVQVLELSDYCDQAVERKAVVDFPPACNGLQIENNGPVRKIGAAVDAGLIPFQQAVDAGVDFLIVHHGLGWEPPFPLTGCNREKITLALQHNLAVYASHLPLDVHPRLGNNALLTRALGLEPSNWWLPYEGRPIAAAATFDGARDTLRERLAKLFPNTLTAIEYGPEKPHTIGVLTGSGQSAIAKMRENGIDTLITGELKQAHFNIAQEHRLNLYLCGHYATEVFGVRALAQQAAEHFGLEWTFIESACPL